MRVSILVPFVAAFALVAPRESSADEVQAPPRASLDLAPLLSRLARHAEQFEQMKRRGSFTLNAKMEELDREGRVDHTTELIARVLMTPSDRVTDIVRFAEDGTDKTAEARKKAEKRRADRASGKGKKDKQRDLRLPFLASEQSRYAFSFVERDPLRAERVRVAFKPHVPAEDAIKGSAWVDEGAGEVLTMGFSFSKNPTFVDHIDVTMRFELPTPLGRAPSNITFEARGGFLIIRKHFRGVAKISEPRIEF